MGVYWADFFFALNGTTQQLKQTFCLLFFCSIYEHIFFVRLFIQSSRSIRSFFHSERRNSKVILSLYRYFLSHFTKNQTFPTFFTSKYKSETTDMISPSFDGADILFSHDGFHRKFTVTIQNSTFQASL